MTNPVIFMTNSVVLSTNPESQSFSLSRDNPETVQRQSRDSSETVQRQSRDRQEAVKKQSSDSDETIMKPSRDSPETVQRQSRDSPETVQRQPWDINHPLLVSICKGQSNIRTVVSVTNKQEREQWSDYRAFPDSPESPCQYVCMSVPSSAVFLEASHWPLYHITRSRPLIGQPLPPPPSESSFKNPAYGRHQLSRPMRIVGPIQIWRGSVIYLRKKKTN